jgi:hypothetical protein
MSDIVTKQRKKLSLDLLLAQHKKLPDDTIKKASILVIVPTVD